VVASLAVRHGVPLVTTSYVGDAMRALDAPAREAGVPLVNEVGVDPGLDHMTALRTMNRVRADGGRIASFRSHCGGLPDAEANDNPFGYKFSWAPRGVLVAATRPARYRWAGEEVVVPGGTLFEHVRPLDLGEDGTFETYPNADAIAYGALYGIEDAETIYRGTLRYPGHGRAWTVIVDLGLLDEVERDLSGLTWAGLIREGVGLATTADVRDGLAAHYGMAPDDDPIARLDWLGVLEDEPIGVERAAPVDVLADRMLARMRYAPGERDLIVMVHEMEAAYPDRREAITSALVVRGEPGGDSAMARTVGLPAAAATRMVLEGRIEGAGVIVPTDPAIYEPILDDLAGQGIAVRETIEPG
jgi:saccharopine dehydrogenase (NADP+, L-glutamate forming)/spermidine synthase